MLRKPLALLFAAAFVVGLAACGDDGGSLTAPAESSGSSGSEAPAASSDTGSGSGSADTTEVPDFSGSGGGEFCGQAQEFDQLFGDQSFAADDPAAIEDSFNQAQDALDQLASSAPDEIKADVNTVKAALDSLVEVFESADYDFTKLAQDPEALAKLESFDSQEVTDASARVQAYLTQVCGIETTDAG